MERRISTNQERVLNFIKEYSEEHCYAPTYREILNGCGFKSASSVKYIMDILFNLGLLETDVPGCKDGNKNPRAYRVRGYHICKKTINDGRTNTDDRE